MVFRSKLTIWCIFIDKYLGGGWSAVALIRVLWIVGLSLVALALDLLVCCIGAAFCGVCAVRDEVLSLHEGCLASFGRVAVLLEGRGSIDIDLDYCWAVAEVGRICTGGQAVSASSGGEACEGVLVY